MKEKIWLVKKAKFCKSYFGDGRSDSDDIKHLYFNKVDKTPKEHEE